METQNSSNKLDNSTTTKYIIKAKFQVDGVVEKPDVVGAIFGQTEGLLGDDLDLRDLQKTGRIGRIDIQLTSRNGKSNGFIIVPSSLDRVETAILAAALEVVDRVGPCSARITIDEKSIHDVRKTKRTQIISRASNILRHWNETVSPESQEIAEEIIKKVRVVPITKYGPQGSPAGPDVEGSDEIIVVEGRADILNLLKCDIRNVVAVEGTKVSKSIAELTKKKKSVIAFLDGDRGGDIILKELLQVGKVNYVARAPHGLEVEDLTRKELLKALSERKLVSELKNEISTSTNSKTTKKPASRTKRKQPEKKAETTRISSIQKSKPLPKSEVRPKIDLPSEIIKEVTKFIADKIKMKAVILKEDYSIDKTVEVRELATVLQERKEIFAVIFDGVITQRILDVASNTDMKYLIGKRRGSITKKPVKIRIYTLDEAKN